MVLSRREIQAAVDRGEIVFEPPLEKTQWGEASVDLRLGFSFTRLNPNRGIKISVAQGLAGLPARGLWTTVQKKRADRLGKPETFTLDPKEFVLPMTHEKVTVPPNLIALVEGRSTYARVGLSVHQTAPWIQPGWRSSAIVLEMLNMGPWQIELTPLVDRPCQLSFLTLSSPLPADERYGAKPGDTYAGQRHPIRVRSPRK
jgi:dCTP deaminase